MTDNTDVNCSSLKRLRLILLTPLRDRVLIRRRQLKRRRRRRRRMHTNPAVAAAAAAAAAAALLRVSGDTQKMANGDSSTGDHHLGGIKVFVA